MVSITISEYIFISFRSPDFKLLLSSCENGSIQIYDQSLSEISGIGCRYGGFNDYDWYPWMNWSESSGCCFVTTSRNLPVELWNVSSDENSCSSVRSTWTAKDHLDQVSTCFSVAISPEGKYVVTGGQSSLWCFDITRPGCDSLIPRSTISSRKCKDGQNGIISNIAFRRDSSNVFAACSFDGSIGIYDLRSLQQSQVEHAAACAFFKAHQFGSSQSKFLMDGWSLVSIGRKENVLKFWDIRKLNEDDFSPVTAVVLPFMQRTNQRIYFDSSFDDSVFIGAGNNLLRIKDGVHETLTQSDSTISSVSIALDDGCIAYSQGSRGVRQDFNDDDDLKEIIQPFQINIYRR